MANSLVGICRSLVLLFKTTLAPFFPCHQPWVRLVDRLQNIGEVLDLMIQFEDLQCP
jgi:hypothetical protein